MFILDRLNLLRQELRSHNLQAYIIPSSDPHQSEYVADHWKSREWISGFTGSAGSALVSMNHAGLWTDSRYFIQAKKELHETGFILHKVYDRTSPAYTDWILENLEEGDRVGINGWLFSESHVSGLSTKLLKKNIELVVEFDLIQNIWGNRPKQPQKLAFVHDLKYAGKSVADKLAEIRILLFTSKKDNILFTALDDIAWLLNIRSSDIEFNPVCVSYLTISTHGACLYVNQKKTKNIEEHLILNDVRMRPYESILDDLQNNKGSFIVDRNMCNTVLYQAIQGELSNINSPVIDLKAIKNTTEIAHIRDTMVKDGIALAKVFYWIENNLKNGIDENSIGEKIIEYRSEQEEYFGESFPAIVGFKENGAIVHYRAPKVNSKPLKEDSLLLCDSGGQYFTGTTDITRTIALGELNEDEKLSYTLVLMGHIDLAMVKFPEGTKGVQLDALARTPLWNHHKNFLHGTGHGVGFFLNVHEGPQGIAPGNSSRGNACFKAGMITSNEPGFYKTGEFGIRIENLVLTKTSKEPGFLENETLSLFPIDKKPILKDLLNDQQIDWLNSYHQLVWNKLSPLLNKDLQNWLFPQCAPL